MGKIEAILKKFLILSVMYPVVVHADCSIDFDNGIAPLIVQSFGSRRIIQNNPRTINLKEGQKIEAYCSSELLVRMDCCGEIPKKEKSVIRSAMFQCISNTLHYEEYEYSGNYGRINLLCSSTSLQMYESNSSLPNCAYMSYGIGMESREEVKRTGLCYDLDTLSIKYAKYLTYRVKKNAITTKRPVEEEDVITLDIELKSSLLSLFSTESFNALYIQKRIENFLLNDLKFEYSSLIDDSGYFNYEDKTFDDMFKIIWWRNLRDGNWKYFMDALKERSDNVTYMAYTGVSGTIDIPSTQDCKKNYKFEIQTNDLTVKAPAYVYTYLKSVEPNVIDEFVVVGFNTPFYNLDKKVELCTDICHEIDWLNKSMFVRTHLMPSFGVTMCCRVEDVLNKLENFPYVNENVASSKTTQSPVQTD